MIDALRTFLRRFRAALDRQPVPAEAGSSAASTPRREPASAVSASTARARAADFLARRRDELRDQL